MARTRYSTVAILFHWIIAALILTNLCLGFRMGFLKGLAQFDMIQLHKSVGITILLLSGLRLAWRIANPPPAEPAGLQAWERAAARAVHWGFYGVMILMPLSGWILVSTSRLNIPTLLFHAIPWPHVPGLHGLPAAPKAVVSRASDLTHLVLAWSALGLLVLHVGAVAKHHVLDGHPILGRMLPPGRRPSVATGSP
jgi:cytochrome b561